MALVKEPVDFIPTYLEVCMEYGVDVENDKRNRFLWNFNLQKQLIVNNDLLEWCGYSGVFKHMKSGFKKLLKKNKHISYTEIPDPTITKKKYVVLNSSDFVSLLIQMRNTKAKEIHEMLTRYEKFKEQTRRKIAEEQHRLVAEKYKIARKRHADVAEALGGIKRQLINIAPRVAPAPINMKKHRQIALICISTGREWYIIRRQREGFNHAVKQILQQFPGSYMIKLWEDVAHSIDIGNVLKQRLRWLKWMARGNTLRVEQSDITYTDRELVDEIDSILLNNPALYLSEFIAQVKDNADIEVSRTAEVEREKAEAERKLAEEQRHRIAEEERKLAENIVPIFGTDIAPRVVHAPKKLALICISTGREWYLIHRQREGFNHAVKQCLKKSPGSYMIKVWEDVAHTIDIGNGLKQRLLWLKWMARKNTLRVEQSGITYTDDEFIDEIDSILKDYIYPNM